MPLPDGELSKDEIAALRRLLLMTHRQSWFFKRAKVTIPLTITIALSLWQALDWIKANVHFK